MKYLKGATPLAIGFLAFLLVVGAKVLDATNIAWLMVKTDRFQHYIGWRLFYNSPPGMPLGRTFDNGIEVANSVVYSDSIPVAAITFKYLFPGFSAHAHYFGIWILACFLLQAMMAWKLVGLLSRDYLVKLGSCTLFVFTPAFLQRIGIHMALGGHFMLLGALYLCLARDVPRRAVWWVSLLGFTTFVHAYLLAMVGGMWIADIVRRRSGGAARAIEMELLCGLVVIALGIWQAGYLTVGAGVNASGFGVHSMNILAPFDPDGWSMLLPDLPNRAKQVEGFNYLGIGTLALILLATGLAVKRRLRMPAGWQRLWPLYVLLTAYLLFAISNTISFGMAAFAVPLPDFAISIANTFRSSGRMAWPVFYFVMLVSIWAVTRGLPGRLAGSLVCLAALLQIADIYPGWMREHASYAAPTSTVWDAGLHDPFWNQAASHYAKVRYLPPWNESRHWKKLTYYAATHHMATDAVYLARVDLNLITTSLDRSLEVMQSGAYEPESLYVVDELALEKVKRSYNPDRDALGMVEGLIVLAPGWKACLTCRQPSPLLPTKR